MSERNPFTIPDDLDFDLREPVEIRMVDGNGNVYTYLGAARDDGTISHSLEANGMSQSLSNSQPRGAVHPRKLLPGWQREMIEFFDRGYFVIGAVR